MYKVLLLNDDFTPMEFVVHILERFFSTKPDPEAARKEAEFRQPIRRMGTTTEIANTILFMSSDECNYMIGANIIVDGGITLKIHENDDTGAN